MVPRRQFQYNGSVRRCSPLEVGVEQIPSQAIQSPGKDLDYGLPNVRERGLCFSDQEEETRVS